MERANTQVLRLSRWDNNAILWANGNTMLPLEKVPRCPCCGGERKFEFQVMPQLIYLLGQEKDAKEYPEIDFGSLIVFTCSHSCEYILSLHFLQSLTVTEEGLAVCRGVRVLPLPLLGEGHQGGEGAAGKFSQPAVVIYILFVPHNNRQKET